MLDFVRYFFTASPQDWVLLASPLSTLRTAFTRFTYCACCSSLFGVIPKAPKTVLRSAGLILSCCFFNTAHMHAWTSGVMALTLLKSVSLKVTTEGNGLSAMINDVQCTLGVSAQILPLEDSTSQGRTLDILWVSAEIHYEWFSTRKTTKTNHRSAGQYWDARAHTHALFVGRLGYVNHTQCAGISVENLKTF